MRWVFGVWWMLWVGRMLRVLGIVWVSRKIHELSPCGVSNFSQVDRRVTEAVTSRFNPAQVESHALRLVFYLVPMSYWFRFQVAIASEMPWSVTPAKASSTALGSFILAPPACSTDKLGELGQADVRTVLTLVLVVVVLESGRSST